MSLEWIVMPDTQSGMPTGFCFTCSNGFDCDGFSCSGFKVEEFELPSEIK